MRYTKYILAILFAGFLMTVVFSVDASAQRRHRRPVIVRQYVYVDPFRSSYYDPFYYNPYYRAARDRYYLEEELAGNERELAKHRRKYYADGVITAKEARELEDDIKDVRNSRARLRSYYRYY